MLFRFKKLKQNRIKVKKGMGSKENVAKKFYTQNFRSEKAVGWAGGLEFSKRLQIKNTRLSSLNTVLTTMSALCDLTIH